MANYDFTYTGAEIQAILDTAKKLKDSGYIFLGVATPSTNPGTPTQKVYYEAKQAGTYTNFGGVVLPDGISLLIWNGSWTSETVMCGDGGVFDISVYKSSGGTLATFADLAAALNGGNNIPVGARKGGMSVKFVQSSDNKYVQARCMAQSFTTDVTQWQGVDDEPTAASENLVKSGGVDYTISSLNGVFKNIKTYPTGGSTILASVSLIRGEKVKLSVSTSGTLTTDNYFRLRKTGNTNLILVTLDASHSSGSGEYIVAEGGEYNVTCYINDSVEYNVEFVCDSTTQDALKIKEINNVIAEETFPTGATSHTERTAIKIASEFYVETSGINETNKTFTIYWFNASNSNIGTTDIRENGVRHITLSENAYSYQIYKGSETATSVVNIKIHAKDIIGGIKYDLQETKDTLSAEIEDNAEDIQDLSASLLGNSVTVPEGTPTTTYPYFAFATATRYLLLNVSTLAGCSHIAIYINRAPSSTIKIIDIDSSNVNQWLKVETSEDIVGITVQLFGSAPNTDIVIAYAFKDDVLGNIQYINDSLSRGVCLNLFGKKIAFCGDSIMKADSDTANPGGWAEIIGKKNLMNYTNFGVSGATIGRSSQTSRACIQDQVTSLDSTWDYIVIQGGCNDIPSNVPLGEITEGYDSTFDTSTLYGGLEYLCKYLMENFPSKKYGFIITYRFGQSNDQTANDLRMDAIKNVCGKWCCPYIDLRKEAGFNLVCKDLRIIFGVPLAAVPMYSTTAGYALDDKVKRIVDGNYITYKANQAIAAPAGDFDATKWTQISDGDDYDSWHANHVAYEQSSHKIQKWMESL